VCRGTPVGIDCSREKTFIGNKYGSMDLGIQAFAVALNGVVVVVVTVISRHKKYIYL
jgi:hypothetical protein